MLLLLATLACEPTTIPKETGRETAVETGPGGDSVETGGDSAPDSQGHSADSDPPDTADWPSSGAACGLATDLESANFLEGDLVAFTLRCTGELATEEAEISALSLPEDAEFAAGSLVFSWQTGPADGGRVDLVFSVRPADDEGAIPTAETVSFWVADDPSDPENVAVDPETYTEEWGLPVVHVQTTGSISTSYSDATVTWRGHSYPASVKIRGASSAYYPKPSYTLEFNEEELPVEEWGVTRDHLLLLTTFDDNAYVRQKMVYDLWAAMADYWDDQRMTPRTLFTVVYLNGSYWGLYVALDRMDNEFLDHMGFERDANLYKAINHNANFYLTNVYGSTKSSMHDGYTKEEGDPEDDFSDLDELVAFTGGSSATDLLAESGDWFDLQEFMDWFLLVHYTTSEDSAGKNSYLYHPQGGGQFRYGPWDFNHAWGQGWYTYRISAEYENYYTGTNRVFWAIQSDTDANAELWERFYAMREDGPYALAWQLALLDEYYALIDDSAARDWAKWASSYRTYGGWASTRSAYGDWQDYEGEKAYLYDWVEARAARFEALHP